MSGCGRERTENDGGPLSARRARGRVGPAVDVKRSPGPSGPGRYAPPRLTGAAARRLCLWRLCATITCCWRARGRSFCIAPTGGDSAPSRCRCWFVNASAARSPSASVSEGHRRRRPMAIAIAIPRAVAVDGATTTNSLTISAASSPSVSPFSSFSPSSSSPFVPDIHSTGLCDAARRPRIASSCSRHVSGDDRSSPRNVCAAGAAVHQRPGRWWWSVLPRGVDRQGPPFVRLTTDHSRLEDYGGGRGRWRRVPPAAARAAMPGQEARCSAEGGFWSPLSSPLEMFSRSRRPGGNTTSDLDDRQTDIARDCCRRSSGNGRPSSSASLLTSLLVRYSCLVCDWWVFQANMRERREMLWGSNLLRGIMEVRGVFLRPRAWIAELVGETARVNEVLSIEAGGASDNGGKKKGEGEEEEEEEEEALVNGLQVAGDRIAAMLEEAAGENCRRDRGERGGWNALAAEEDTIRKEEGRDDTAVDEMMEAREQKEVEGEEEEEEARKEFWIKERMAALMREVERRTNIQEYMRPGLIGWVTGERQQGKSGDRGPTEEQLIIGPKVQEMLDWEQRKKASPGAKIPGFSFSAAGLLFPYHLGVTKCLMEYGYITEDTFLSGSSAGSLVCAVIVGGLTMEEALYATKRLAEDCRENGTAFRLGAVLRKFLVEFLPEDAHEKASGRIQVAVTQVFRSPRSLLVDKFESKEDMIDALITSCFIPGYLAPRPVTIFRNRVCIDGGITAFMPPTASETTVRVCAFPTSSFGLKDDGISPDRNPVDRPSVSQVRPICSCSPYALTEPWILFCSLGSITQSWTS
ncbi:hypothetical protein CBR_g22336 [Chara braunii]|uniref:Patatin n=1 Tax=Chara braunii TaxID=69332 RepID=A0A388JUP6_CHABU|nr:hypothetical protein CBR_g22336 [Chara braunii]|eukprot:GBG61539.1 hypothetical protein CBR_g22336 [Chara braunii]